MFEVSMETQTYITEVTQSKSRTLSRTSGNDPYRTGRCTSGPETLNLRILNSVSYSTDQNLELTGNVVPF